MSNINKLAKEIYEQNKAVGWWDDPNRCPYQTLQLVSTEIAEATEGERKGLNDEHLPDRPMAEVELADALIRVLDIGGRYEWIYSDDFPTPGYYDMVLRVKSAGGKHAAINVCLSELIKYIFRNKTNGVDVNVYYSTLIRSIVHTAESANYDLFGALREKLEYNKKRADHKRENRAKEGGKKF